MLENNLALPENVKALNGDKLFPFQIEGVRFIQSADGHAGILDECGLGKTVQVLAWLYLNFTQKTPALAVVKATLKTQWQRQFANWCSDDHDDGYRFAQIIDTKYDTLLPGFPFYIISYDLIRRFSYDDADGKKQNKFAEMLKARKVKTLILDEVQQIKNHSSKRASELHDIARFMENVIGLSGTPIKNNAQEFWSFLHMVAPHLYPSYAAFIKNDLSGYSRFGKFNGMGLRDPEAFRRKNEKFLIRRSRSEVLPQLPLVNKVPMFVDLGDKVREAYKEKYKQFKSSYSLMGNKLTLENRGEILKYMSEMRHLTGYAKIEPCLDFCMDFLASTDDERICIFCHHVDVAKILADKLTAVMAELGMTPPVNLVAMSPETREKAKDDWLKTDSRILILSTLASGEGLDGLQRVSHQLITLEREWNPANEEQVEGRFSRIGQEANHITNTIFVAVGTIDEFFAKIVEKKRQLVSETLDGEASSWTEASILQELAEVLAISGGQEWGL